MSWALHLACLLDGGLFRYGLGILRPSKVGIFRPSLTVVKDRLYRARLLAGTLSRDDMLAQCNDEWVAEIVPSYAVFEVLEGPRFNYMSDLLASCIAEANEAYS